MNFLLALFSIAITSLLVIGVIALRRLCLKCPQIVLKLLMRLESKVYLNAILRTCTEMYLSMCINFFVQANQLRAWTYEEKIDVLLLACSAFFIVYFPYWAWNWLYEAYFDGQKLFRQEVRLAYDTLYMNIEIDKGPQALANTLAFLVRRLLFAYVIG